MSSKHLLSEQLINEIRLSFNLLVRVGDRLHKDIDISLGMRAVLEHLQNNGAMTVPQIAKNRHVTRQRIQVLINRLAELDYVDSIENPRHQRSNLITITDAGSRCINEMRDKEAEVLKSVLRGINADQLTMLTRGLGDVRNALETISLTSLADD